MSKWKCEEKQPKTQCKYHANKIKNPLQIPEEMPYNKTKLQKCQKSSRGKGSPGENFIHLASVESIFCEISRILEIASDRFPWLENHLKLVSKASGSFLDQS